MQQIYVFFNVQENVKKRKKLIKIISNYFDLNVLLTNCLQMCCMQHSFWWRYKYYDLCQFPCKPRKDFKYFEFFLHSQGLLVHVSGFFYYNTSIAKFKFKIFKGTSISPYMRIYTRAVPKLADLVNIFYLFFKIILFQLETLLPVFTQFRLQLHFIFAHKQLTCKEQSNYCR